MKTDKGALSRDDFNHIQKLISLNVSSLSYEERIQNQRNRIPFLDEKDYKGYIEQLFSSFSNEISNYNQAQTQVLDLARINPNVYMASHNEYTNDKEGLKDFLILTFTSPFIASRPLSKDEAKKILIECTTQALKEVQMEELSSLIHEKDDILVIYELLVLDYVNINHSINCEDFKAIVSKHDLLTEDKESIEHIQEIANVLYELNSKFP